MRLAFITAILMFASCAAIALPVGQTTSTAHKAAAPAKRYCHAAADFCFCYPSSWSILGDIFAGNGVVIAPEQAGDRALWDEITVALISPAPGDGQEGPSLNHVIDQATAAMRDTGDNLQMLQRQERTIDHNPAQVLKTRYREKSTGREWLEELVFIEGPQSEIYSVALKCAPEHLARLEPAMKQVLASWTLPQPSTETHPQSAPSQAAPAASGGSPATHP